MLKARRRIYSVLLAVTLGVSLAASKSLTVTAEDSDVLNYGEALQKSLMFYEFQRSGKLPANIRDNWRGDSGMNDGDDVGLDLTGGWYDAGDHVKFNLPMAYTSTMLAWSLYEDKDAYVNSGQLSYAVDNIKWANDYLMKCHPADNVYYYQVGDGGADHKWWGPAEVMQMDRPSYKVDLENPGSTVVAQSAASLAAAAVALKDSDPEYAAKCIEHAKQLFEFADVTKSDAGYLAANGYYNSWSGFYDELSWSATWLYLATNDSTYLDRAEVYTSKFKTENQSTTIAYKWAHCWDDVHYGAQLLLARITNKDSYKENVERSLDYWTTGYNDGNGVQRIKYTPQGLAWMDSWGSLRYATTMGFLADVYAEWDGCTTSKVAPYQSFAKSQVDYALGSTGKSFEVGFGVNPPLNVHHRTAHSSWSDQQTVPAAHRHLLYGALVGGPDSSDKYTDEINNYTNNEVACDYNAGFTGLLARMYDKEGGTTIADFKAIEKVTNDEMFVEAVVNAIGPNFVEIKALLNNRSGWPARMGDKLSYRYFIDISELVEKGYGPEDVTLSVNYNTGGVVSNLIPWNAEKNIYYVNVDFTGVKIYPGGQSDYKKEIQFRIAAPKDVNIWDSSNDFSYEGIGTTPGGTPIQAKNISVYDNGVKVYGNEPENGNIPVLIGDINDDGKVNIIDYITLKRHILGLNDNINLKAADLNGDGAINIFDYLKLKKSMLA